MPDSTSLPSNTPRPIPNYLVGVMQANHDLMQALLAAMALNNELLAAIKENTSDNA